MQRWWPARRSSRRSAGQHGTELKAVAIQFCLAHPAVTVALQGARSADEAADNIAMAALPVPPSLWQELRARGLIDPRAPLPGDVA